MAACQEIENARKAATIAPPIAAVARSTAFVPRFVKAVTEAATNGNNGLISSSGSLEATDVGISDFTDDTPGFPIELGALQDRFNVSLPVSGAAGSFALAILGSDYLVDLELSALQAEGRGEGRGEE